MWNVLNSKTIKVCLYFQHSHTKLSSEFLLIHTHRDIYASSFILDKLFPE